jgi:primase-polymerase (primpol)-like protein
MFSHTSETKTGTNESKKNYHLDQKSAMSKQSAAVKEFCNPSDAPSPRSQSKLESAFQQMQQFPCKINQLWVSNVP